MRKAFLLFAITFIITSAAFAQLEVKKESFKQVPGFVNINPDPNYQTDDNDEPFAVIKIRTENISSKQRRELTFGGDARTYFVIEYKDGEVWLYISYYASFIKISHDELSSTEFYFPFDMQPKCGYELTLINNMAPATTGFGSLTINTLPVSGASIVLNDRELDVVTPYTSSIISAGNYSIKVSKEGFRSVTKEVQINDGNNIVLDIEMPYIYGNISIKSEPSEAQVYIDNKYYGLTPLYLNGRITVGTHQLNITKTNCLEVTRSFKLTENKTVEFNEILQTKKNVTITAGNKGNMIYVDGKLVGRSPLNMALTFGQHQIKSVESDITVEKTINVELNSEPQYFTLEFSNRLTINSDINGLDVYVDDVKVGQTPYSGNVKCGEHKIVLDGSYGQEKRTVNVTTEGQNTYHIGYAYKIRKANRLRFYENFFFRGYDLGAFVGFNNIYYDGDYIKTIKSGVIKEDIAFGGPAWLKSKTRFAKNYKLSIRFVGAFTLEKRLFPYVFVESDMMIYQERFKFSDFYWNGVQYDYYSENYSMYSIPLIAKVDFLDDFDDYREESFGIGIGYQWDVCYKAVSKYRISGQSEVKTILVEGTDYIRKNNSLVFSVFGGISNLYGQLRVNVPLKKITPEKDIQFTTIMLTVGTRINVIRWR